MVPELQELLKEVRNKTYRPAAQPSSHGPPVKPLPDIPEGVTHVYTRQHKKTGLQAAYEGPFKVHSRPTKSTFKIEVGLYRDGEPRYEIRHANDLKIAHEDSLAAPASRPALGRPPNKSPTPLSSSPDPNPSTGPPSIPPFSKEQTGGGEIQTTPDENYETLSGKKPHPDYLKRGPIITKEIFDKWTPDLLGIPSPPPDKPVRKTRNPNPKYVDAMWSASQQEIDQLNYQLSYKL